MTSKFGVFIIIIGLFTLYGCAGVKVARDIKPEEGWKFVGIDAKGIKVYCSLEDIGYPSKDIIRLRTKSVLIEAKQKPAGLEDFEYVIQIIEIDCPMKKVRPIQTDGYRKDGTSVSDDSPAKWTDITSGSSVGAQLYNIACQR